MYEKSDSIEKAVIISTSLLKRQNLESLSILKNLLTFIPNPHDIQKVWKIAICHLVNTCPQSSYWLFQNPDCLKPDINVREVIIEELSQKLLSWDLSPEEFYFNSEGRLIINSPKASQFIAPRELSCDQAVLALISFLILESNGYDECLKY